VSDSWAHHLYILASATAKESRPNDACAKAAKANSDSGCRHDVSLLLWRQGRKPRSHALVSEHSGAFPALVQAKGLVQVKALARGSHLTFGYCSFCSRVIRARSDPALRLLLGFSLRLLLGFSLRLLLQLL
jgi:hypothetical protein